jgi:hypothetical protein
MNEQDWANRFREDLDAILQGRHPENEAPTEEYREMLALSHTFSTLDMSEDSRIRRTLKHKLLHAPARKRRSSQGDDNMNSEFKNAQRRPATGVYAAIAALLLVLAAALMIPAVRASASALFRFFVPGETDANPGMQPTVVPPAQGAGESSEHSESLSGLTLDQVIAAVEADEVFTYDVRVPGSLPAGMVYADGIVDSFGRMVILNYVCEEDRLAVLSLTMRGLANPNPMVDPSTALEVGSSATVQPVDINGVAGEYVQGDFGLDGNWDSRLPVQTLSWQYGEVLYRLRSYVQAGSACSVTQDDLIATAASLLP